MRSSHRLDARRLGAYVGTFLFQSGIAKPNGPCHRTTTLSLPPTHADVPIFWICHPPPLPPNPNPLLFSGFCIGRYSKWSWNGVFSFLLQVSLFLHFKRIIPALRRALQRSRGRGVKFGVLADPGRRTHPPTSKKLYHLRHGITKRDRRQSPQCPQKWLHSTSRRLECTVHNPVAVANYTVPSHPLHEIFDHCGWSQ